MGTTARQRRLASRRRAAGKEYATRDIGGGLVGPTLGAITKALLDFDHGMGWDQAKERILPLLPRRIPAQMPAGTVAACVELPPGIEVSFGIDIGPGWAVLPREQLRAWSVDDGALVAAALGNLRSRLAAISARDLLSMELGGVTLRTLQTGLDCASGLLLLPDEIGRILGSGPQILIAPMRDILISLPIDVDPLLAIDLNDGMAENDPRGLALDPFVFEAGDLLPASVVPIVRSPEEPVVH